MPELHRGGQTVPAAFEKDADGDQDMIGVGAGVRRHGSHPLRRSIRSRRPRRVLKGAKKTRRGRLGRDHQLMVSRGHGRSGPTMRIKTHQRLLERDCGP